MSSPSYDRAPSPHLRRLLEPGGFLAPLRAKRTLEDIDLEVHLRRRDEVHVYCGLTRLVSSGPSTGAKVWVKTHRTYAEQSCAKLLIRPSRRKEAGRGQYVSDEWRIDEQGFSYALDVFLGNVQVDRRQMKEGAIQARWAQIGEPWVAFDKEAALGYPSEKERTRQLREAFDPSVDEARRQLCAFAESRRLLPNRRTIGRCHRNRRQDSSLTSLQSMPPEISCSSRSRWHRDRRRRSTTLHSSFCKMPGSGIVR